MSALLAVATLKVLMIGNSFSGQMVPSLPPVAADLGLKLDICSLYIGGCTLERHWRNVRAPETRPYWVTRRIAGVAQKERTGNIPETLAAEDWDVITIQQGSECSIDAASFHPWGDDLVAYLRREKPRAKIVLHETWSYTPWDSRIRAWKMTPEGMYARIHAAAKAFAAQHGLEVIPTGKAVQLVRSELPVRYAENSLGGDVVGSAKFVREEGRWVPKGDVYHMGPDGNYLQALVWAAKLFGADVTTCTYAPDGMPSERAVFLRRIAQKAVFTSKVL